MTVVMRAVGAIAVAVCCGCYSYQPVSLSEIAPASQVRARLTVEEIARLESVVPVEGRVIEGEVLERNAGDVLLLVPVATDVVGARVESLSQRLRVPDSSIIEVELRQIDRFRTSIAIGAGVAVVGSAVVAALTVGGRSDRPGTGPSPVELVVPIGLRIPVGR